ncbi:hypothetical protein OPQ81_007374 [Rhizoctonia solani]|nr:hypothetical protein OPQ81_007374 [Rhizoctonia solani]
MTLIDIRDKEEADDYAKSGPSDERSRLLGEGTEAPERDPPYQANYETTSSGDIYSRDRHLNEDGEALYQFLVSQANVPPKFLLKCRGTHPETHVKHVTRTETVDGRTVTVTEPETHTETMVDFDFTIDISHYLRQIPPVIWTVPDDEPTYRGRMEQEVMKGNMSAIGGASRGTINMWKIWREKREKWGLAPWLGITEQPDMARRVTPADESMSNRSRLTLRQWVDQYCASNKSMKVFNFRKSVYGWNIDALTQVVRATIQRTLHARSPTITVEFTTSAYEINIRPSSIFAQALSKHWVVVLLCITFIYPFIWLYGISCGGRWEVAGSAFPLCTWKHCEDSIPGESAESYRRRTFKDAPGETASSKSERNQRTDDRILAETPNGVSQLIGTTERDWLLIWESTITHCVTSRVQEGAPVTTPHGLHTAALLDDLRPPIHNRLASLGLQAGPTYPLIAIGHVIISILPAG